MLLLLLLLLPIALGCSAPDCGAGADSVCRRVGAGAGAGVIRGSVWRDSKLRRCNADNDEDCVVVVANAINEAKM